VVFNTIERDKRIQYVPYTAGLYAELNIKPVTGLCRGHVSLFREVTAEFRHVGKFFKPEVNQRSGLNRIYEYEFMESKDRQ